MKRLLFCFFIVSLAFVFFACGNSDTPNIPVYEQPEQQHTLNWIVNGEIYYTETVYSPAVDYAFTKPRNPEKPGYSFIGWYFDYEKSPAQFSESELYSRSARSSTVNIFASFQQTAKTYRITLTKTYQDGTYSENSSDRMTIDVVYGEPFTLPTPTRSGKHFVGWYDYYDQDHRINNGVCDWETDLVLIAKWEDDPETMVYELTYLVDGNVYTTNSTIGRRQVELPVSPEKPGYDFAGWYLDDQTFRKPFGENSLKTLSLSSPKICVYARFQPKTYRITLTYTLSSGEYSVQPTDQLIINAVYGEHFTLPVPTRCGKQFAGWYNYYDQNQSVSSGVFRWTNDVTLVAKWILDPELEPFKYTLNESKKIIILDGLNDSTVSRIATPSNYVIVYINASAFAGCTNLIEVTLGNNVELIAENAFSGCSNLSKVTIGNHVSAIGDDAFANCTKLQSIVIPDSVTSLRDGVFSGCTGLTTISLGRSVSAISTRLFQGCSSLETLTIPDSAQYVGSLALSGCTSLKELTIGNGISYLYSGLLSSCTGLTKLTIGKGITSIHGSFLKGLASLQELVIPDSVTNIGEGALSGCASLVSITIPFVGARADKTASDTYQYPFGYIFGTSSYTGGLATKQSYYGSSTSSTTYTTYYIPSSLRYVTITGGNILRGAFEGCSGLTSVTIPNITSIGYNAFYRCSGLTSVYYTGDIAGWCGLTFGSYDNNPLCYAHNLYLNGVLLTDLVIPDTVTAINDYAFYNCSSLTSVTIPDSVTKIGYAAFSGCSSLESITIPFVGDKAGKTASDKYQTTFGYIFGTSSYTGGTATTQYYYGYGSSTSSTYYIPSSLRSVTITGGNIPSGAFGGCSMLTSVTIGNGVMSIGERAFSGCSALTSITIPDSVTSIGEYAFSGCSGLESITSSSPDYPAVGNCLIEAKTGTLIAGCKNSVIPTDGSVTSIGDSAFFRCSGLTSVTIPDSVTSIGSGAFCYCTGLTSVTIPDSVTCIRDSMFSNCSGLTSVTIPDSVTSIEYYAFSSTGLTEINFTGTKAQWNGISKGNTWSQNTGSYTIHCKDGDI